MLELPVAQLVQIVANGGGIEIDAARLPKDAIVQIAANAKSSGARVVITNADRLSQTDLVQIAAHGKGVVFFKT